MTHTLHRTKNVSGGLKEYVIFSMAAQGYNDKGSTEKLKDTLKILLKHDPVNIGDDNIGGIHTGETIEGILAHAGTKSYMAAVYTDRVNALEALRELKVADLGMPVVVTGDREETFDMLREIGMAPHTVNLSLGYFGKMEKLPPPEVLDITTMCGHGMVCSDHVRYIIRQVTAGKMTPREAALDLAKPCTCAMFNPERAAHIISSVTGKPSDTTTGSGEGGKA